MTERTTKLEWQVALEKTEWARPETLSELVEAPNEDEASANQATRRSWWRRPVLMTAVGTLLLSLCSVGFVLWWQARAGYQQIRAEIADTVELEAWSVQTGDHTVAATLLDESAPAEWSNRFLAHESARAGVLARR